MTITTAEFKNILRDFIPSDSRPVIIYSGLWYFAKSFKEPFSQLPAHFLEIIHDLVGDQRTLLMPTYTSGFKEGVFDLKNTPGQTGVLSELFRKSPGTLRTASAFFSFAAQGKEAKNLSLLRPDDAWGEGSVFEWAHETDAHMVMIGESWDACSLKHRAEWLHKVKYRYLKDFSGELIDGSNREILNERLYVRSLNPNVENVWTNINQTFLEGGMTTVPFGGGQIAHMNTKPLINQVLARLKQDEFTFTQDPQEIRKLFYGKIRC